MENTNILTWINYFEDDTAILTIRAESDSIKTNNHLLSNTHDKEIVGEEIQNNIDKLETENYKTFGEIEVTQFARGNFVIGLDYITELKINYRKEI